MNLRSKKLNKENRLRKKREEIEKFKDDMDFNYLLYFSLEKKIKKIQRAEKGYDKYIDNPSLCLLGLLKTLTEDRKRYGRDYNTLLKVNLRNELKN